MTKAPKAQLAEGGRIRLDAATGPGAAAGLGAGTPVIRTVDPTREALPKRAARSIIGLLLLAAVLIAGLYTVLAVTVLVVMRADGHNAIVLRSAFPVGQAPAGAYAYVSAQPVDYSVLGKIKQATVGVPAGSVVQIVAGPAAAIATDAAGMITVNGQPTIYRGNVDTMMLKRQYVALCVTGACAPGDPYLIEQDNIIGGVKGFLGTDGITEPTTPPAPEPGSN